jgi:5-methylcytosine-specific restriction endonuclease McrA
MSLYSDNIGDKFIVIWDKDNNWYNAILKKINFKEGVKEFLFLCEDGGYIEGPYTGDNFYLKDQGNFYYYINDRKNRTLHRIAVLNNCNIKDLIEINKDFLPRITSNKCRCDKGQLIKIPKKNYVRKTPIKKRKRKKITDDSIISFNKKSKRKVFDKYEKEQILQKQNYCCNTCEERLPFKENNENHKKVWLYELDHIIPISKNGTNSLDNIHALCPWCHNDKTYNHDRGIINALVVNSKNTGKEVTRMEIIKQLKQRSPFLKKKIFS